MNLEEKRSRSKGKIFLINFLVKFEVQNLFLRLLTFVSYSIYFLELFLESSKKCIKQRFNLGFTGP